jgi:hypothetical protein
VPRAQTISRADKRLIAALARRDIDVSDTQLERWRQAGLLQSPVRHGLGRGRGSTSEYPPDAVDQAAELSALVRRGQPMERVALMMFARGRWVRPDALRDAYRYELKWFTKWLEARSVPNDPLASAEAIVDELDKFTKRDKRIKQWRRRLDHNWKASVRETAAKEAALNERAKPTPDDLARARAQHESPENTLRSALVGLVHVLLAGTPSYEDALAEFLDAAGVSGVAEERARPGIEALPPVLLLLTRVLEAVSLESLRRLIEEVSIEELQSARGAAHAMAAAFSNIIDEPSDTLIAFGALALVAVHRSLSSPESRILDAELAAMKDKSPARPLQRPAGTAHGKDLPHAAPAYLRPKERPRRSPRLRAQNPRRESTPGRR